MNVTSLELSEELYELSGWDGTSYFYPEYDDGKYRKFAENRDVHILQKAAQATGLPAYDAGFLLRKLPPVYEEPSGTRWILKLEISDGYWDCYYLAGSPLQTLSDTPEDALAKLAIELIKQGILTPRKEPTDV